MIGRLIRPSITACRRAFAAMPAHKVMPMPSLSPTMEVGSIKWSIKEGDKFEAGQVLAEVETDKATVTMDATDEGYVAKILVEQGEIKVGEPIMITVDEQADIAAFVSYSPPAAAAAQTAPALPKAAVAPVAAPVAAVKAAPIPSPAVAAASPKPSSQAVPTSPTSTLPVSAVASVRWSTGKSSGALGSKLALDQLKYYQKWGFSGFLPDPSALPKAAKKNSV